MIPIERRTHSHFQTVDAQVSGFSSFTKLPTQADSLSSYAKAEQQGEGGCIQKLCSCIANAVYSLFKMIFCCCRKEDPHPTHSSSVDTEDLSTDSNQGSLPSYDHTSSNQTSSNQTSSNQTSSNQTSSNQTSSNQTSSDQTSSNHTSSGQHSSDGVEATSRSGSDEDSNYSSSLNASQERWGIELYNPSGKIIEVEKRIYTNFKWNIELSESNEKEKIIELGNRGVKKGGILTLAKSVKSRCVATKNEFTHSLTKASTRIIEIAGKIGRTPMGRKTKKIAVAVHAMAQFAIKLQLRRQRAEAQRNSSL
jgi:hypothetical protein